MNNLEELKDTVKTMEKLNKMARQALAVEHGAYNAYSGHVESLFKKGLDKEANEVFDIRMEELVHQYKLRAIMSELGIGQNYLLNDVFVVIGKVISALCYVTGYKMPMFGAKILEKTAGVNYRELARLAYKLNRPSIAIDFEHMAEAEERHEAYFASKL